MIPALIRFLRADSRFSNITVWGVADIREATLVVTTSDEQVAQLVSPLGGGLLAQNNAVYSTVRLRNQVKDATTDDVGPNLGDDCH
jgi:hypothetical protein